jgi:RND family efflux transporter MFP subunit
MSESGRRASLARLFAAAALLAACGGEPEYVAPPAPAVTVARPVQRNVTEYIEMTGSVSSIETVEIRARVAGFLKSIEFEEGDFVDEGDPLYVIDPSDYQARVDRAQASIEMASASVGLANATLRRLEQARRTGAVSELEVLESRAKRDVAVARLESVRAELRDAQLNLGYTQIFSPVSGRVSRSLVDPGNLVGAGEMTLLTTVVRFDPIYAYFTISERAVLKLLDSTRDMRGVPEPAEHERLARLRQIPIELGRANDQGYPIRGNLHYSDPGIDPETGTYLLRAIFPNPQPVKLLPGIFARGRVPLGTREGALLVSERALGSDQGGRYVLVIDSENIAHHRPVRVGTLEKGMRVIEQGLEPDDWVITNGILRVRPGAMVRPEREGEAADAEASGG